MSGALQYRVNRAWDSTVQAGVAAVRFFWDWLQFINTHTNMDVVEVGTATTSHGSTIPAQWLSWDGIVDPTTLSPALTHNSWIVFRAVNADPLLNGGGGMPWEAKIQMTMGTAYSDPSGTDYGLNGQTHNVVLRSCPTGGWTGTPTWDFVPGGGEAPSQDMRMFGYTSSQADKDYYLDITADDDTVWWRTSTGDFPTDDAEIRSRGGYLGMLNRRNSDITWPFFAMCGPACDETGATSGERMILSRHSPSSDYGIFNYKRDQNLQWYSYSLGYDGTRVEGHRIDSWHLNAITYINTFHYTSDDLFPRMLLFQREQPDKHGILGELRGYVTTSISKGFSVVFGASSDLIQVGAYPASYGGIGMPWPAGFAPIW